MSTIEHFPFAINLFQSSYRVKYIYLLSSFSKALTTEEGVASFSPGWTFKDVAFGFVFCGAYGNLGCSLYVYQDCACVQL